MGERYIQVWTPDNGRVPFPSIITIWGGGTLWVINWRWGNGRSLTSHYTLTTENMVDWKCDQSKSPQCSCCIFKPTFICFDDERITAWKLNSSCPNIFIKNKEASTPRRPNVCLRHYRLNCLVVTLTLTFDLENVFSSAHSRDEYLWQVLLKSLH